IDDYSVRYTFDEPNTLFLIELANQDGADRRLASFLPRHYLSQFHPSYASQDDLDALIQGTGLGSWAVLFMTRATPAENPERPTMGAWVPHTSSASAAEFVLRRIASYVGGVPSAQRLPYFDEVRFRYLS